MISSASHDLFRRRCGDARRFVLTTHLNPDGDAIGSVVSLALFLQSLGKELRIVNHDRAPDNLAFIEVPEFPVEAYDPGRHDACLEAADRLILVDNSAPDRLGRMESPLARLADRTLCIDHHPARDAPWADNIVDVESCATAIMIYELTRACGWQPDRRAAEAIYVGLATDTGFFRFNSTNVRCHEVAAELLATGIGPARAYGEIYERNSVAFTRLLGHALTGLRTAADGAIVAVKIERTLLQDLQAEDEDTSEITTALLAIDGVRVALLFRELSEGRVKVSLRSKGELDVHSLATEYGGGGHRNASGIVMPGELDRVTDTVIERAATLLAAARQSGS